MKVEVAFIIAKCNFLYEMSKDSSKKNVKWVLSACFDLGSEYGFVFCDSQYMYMGLGIHCVNKTNGKYSITHIHLLSEEKYKNMKSIDLQKVHFGDVSFEE